MQVWEGFSKDLHKVYESIRKDVRNNGVVEFIEEEIDQRDYPGWSTGFKNLEVWSYEDMPGYINIFN